MRWRSGSATTKPPSGITSNVVGPSGGSSSPPSLMLNTLPSAGAAAGSATTRAGIVTERVNPTTAALAEAAAGAPVLGVALSLVEQPANATTQELSRNVWGRPPRPSRQAGRPVPLARPVLMDRPAGSTARGNIRPGSTRPGRRSQS